MTLILMVGVMITGILLLQPLIPRLTYLLFGNLDHVTYVRVVLVGMMIGNLIPLLLTLFRAEGKARRFTVISLLQLIFQLTLNIIFVVWLQRGGMGCGLEHFDQRRVLEYRPHSLCPEFCGVEVRRAMDPPSLNTGYPWYLPLWLNFCFILAIVSFWYTIPPQPKSACTPWPIAWGCWGVKCSMP